MGTVVVAGVEGVVLVAVLVDGVVVVSVVVVGVVVEGVAVVTVVRAVVDIIVARSAMRLRIDDNRSTTLRGAPFVLVG